MSLPPPRAREAGFTLIEMLVALAVVAAVGMAGLTVLETIVRVQERTQGRIERLERLDLAFLLIGRDVAQSRPESILLDGDRLSLRRPASGGTLTLSYGVADGALRRWVQAEGTGEAVMQRLMDGASGLGFRFLREDRSWSPTWPPEETGAAVGDAAPLAPLGIELTLALDPGEEAMTLVRLFEPPRAPVPVRRRWGSVAQ